MVVVVARPHSGKGNVHHRSRLHHTAPAWLLSISPRSARPCSGKSSCRSGESKAWPITPALPHPCMSAFLGQVLAGWRGIAFERFERSTLFFLCCFTIKIVERTASGTGALAPSVWFWWEFHFRLRFEQENSVSGSACCTANASRVQETVGSRSFRGHEKCSVSRSCSS